MNQDTIFTPEDTIQIIDHGLSVAEVKRHLELFKKNQAYQELLRPCKAGDGIKLIDPDRAQTLIDTYEIEVLKGRCIKFVPASGAASRMFRTLLKQLNSNSEITEGSNNPLPKTKEGKEFLQFINNIKHFAFFKDLKDAMADNGLNIEELLDNNRFTEILSFLLNNKGLDYASLPKGLIKFHKYSDGARTAFEEHLVEAVSYVTDKDRKCRIHFTVLPEQQEKFRKALEQVKKTYENKYNVLLHVDFSLQKKSTDTLAVNLDNAPFRDDSGRLVFRPGGHGSLLENLKELQGDII